MPQTSLPLVFVPGFKGSLLKDSEDKTVWLRARQIFGTEESLRLPLEWSGGIQERDTLNPAGPLSSVLWSSIYKPFLKWALKLGRPFYTFSYDWRRSNMETMVLLQEFLESIYKKHGARP